MTSLSDPAGTVSYTYDVNGNVLTVSDSAGTISRKYDALNRVTEYTDTKGNTIRYDYDAVGNLTALTYPGGKQVRYDYDAANRLTRVTDLAGRVTSYEYDANNRLVRTTRPNGTAETRSYDAAGQLTYQSDLDAAGNVIAQYDYIYDSAGNVATEESAVPKLPFTLDNASMIFTSGDRLATFNGQPVSFDADGNMTTGPLGGQLTNYVYDARNRLMSASNLSYQYDAENNRISVTDNVYNTQTGYMINPNNALSQVLIQTDAQGNQIYYVYGLGLVGQEQNGNYLTYHFDLRGSTVALSDNSGNITDRFQYAPYGEMVKRTGNTSTPFLYNSRYGVVTEGNGLYYMRTRYYNPEISRFVNQDRLLGSLDKTLSLNRYTYVQGNPVRYIDPSGKWKEEVHFLMTLDWAKSEGFSYDEAKTIATWDNSVDSFGETNPVLWHSWHFNRNLSTVDPSWDFNNGPQCDDSRVKDAEEQFEKANNLLDEALKNPEGKLWYRDKILQEIGKGLHPLQDVPAHMNYGIDQWPIHKKHSPEHDNVNLDFQFNPVDKEKNPRLLKTENLTRDYLKRAKNLLLILDSI